MIGAGSAALRKVIEHDPGLTANVLQLANSAYFGWFRTIKTVKEDLKKLQLIFKIF